MVDPDAVSKLLADALQMAGTTAQSDAEIIREWIVSVDTFREHLERDGFIEGDTVLPLFQTQAVMVKLEPFLRLHTAIKNRVAPAAVPRDDPPEDPA